MSKRKKSEQPDDDAQKSMKGKSENKEQQPAEKENPFTRKNRGFDDMRDFQTNRKSKKQKIKTSSSMIERMDPLEARIEFKRQLN